MDDGASLLAFYSGRGRDHRGRTLADIQRLPDAELEFEHDFIQWLFPLEEPSPFNPAAPVLTTAVVERFRRDDVLRRALRASFITMAGFYGFAAGEREGRVTVERGEHFAARATEWITPGNHNFRRITRILKSLATLGEEATAVAFLEALERECAPYATTIGQRTWHFWRDALGHGAHGA